MRIDVEDLVLRYGSTTALDGLTFSLAGGKIYGLLGRSGSGKTSLLSVLAAFRRQTAGSVRVGGQPIFENPVVTRDVIMIRDGGETVRLGTGADAIYFAEGLRPNWDGDYARTLMDRFGLEPKKQVAAMSKGQRSAMGVVIGLASRAPLSIFDESYLGMDVPSRYAFYEALLADYMLHPRTIIISAHLIDEVGPLLEEVVIIDRGRLVVHEETERLLGQGCAVTGATDTVDSFTAELTVLNTRELGPTKSAMVYGELDETRRRQAAEAGLELSPINMQDLFLHLTGGPR